MGAPRICGKPRIWGSLGCLGHLRWGSGGAAHGGDEEQWLNSRTGRAGKRDAEGTEEAGQND